MSADDTPAFPATLRAVYNATTPASRVIADLAPQLLARNVLQSLPPRPDDKRALQDSRKSRGLLATIGRGPAKALLPSGGRRVESSSTTSALDLAVIESVDDLLDLPIVSPSTSSHEKLLSSTLSPTPDAASSVSLFAGFQATAPSASQSRKNRRRRRAYLSESHLGIAHGSQLGLKSRVDHARGLLASSSSSTILEETSSVSSKSLGDDTLIEGEGDFEIIRHATSSPKRSSAQSTPRVRKTMAASHYKSNPDAPASERLSKAELLQDVAEIEQDQHHLQTRRHVLTQEAAALDEQIHKLQASRDVLRKGLLGLKEEELELQDELDGVREQLESIDLSSSRPSMLDPTASPRNNVPATSRRRKGPAFLPNEHDSLPVGVAFMPLHGHNAPIAALDFSEPYGLLVSSSAGADDSSMRVWDLSTGTQVDTLQISKQEDAIKCLQVESTFCVSGQADGHLKVWDLEKLGEDAAEMGSPTLGSSLDEVEGPCVLDLEAHTKAITSLYFDGPCLVSVSRRTERCSADVPQVTGSSDKTLRQWDLGTGQSILTVRSNLLVSDKSLTLHLRWTFYGL